MKRMLSWIACITAALCLPNLAWGNSETESAWVRGNVFAVSPDGGLELVVLPAWIFSQADVLAIGYLQHNKTEINYITKQRRIAKKYRIRTGKSRHGEQGGENCYPLVSLEKK